MKKLLLFSMLVIALPQTMSAQDDDLYFVPKKTTAPEVAQDRFGMPKDTYYSGSDRSVDEYNRRFKSRVEVLDGDTTKNDIIDFSAEKGVYPDSLQIEDYKLTKRMSRFEDYRLADNAAFWAGYDAGRRDWGWHSPWYYSSYGWYDPWYYSSWRWYDPWYDPWYYGYAGWYDPWYYRPGWGWGWSWRYPYYRPHYVVISGGGRRHSGYIGTGTIQSVPVVLVAHPTAAATPVVVVAVISVAIAVVIAISAAVVVAVALEAVVASAALVAVAAALAAEVVAVAAVVLVEEGNV